MASKHDEAENQLSRARGVPHSRAKAKWVDELIAAVGTLGRMPERGRRVPEADRPDLRELLFGRYRAVIAAAGS